MQPPVPKYAIDVYTEVGKHKPLSVYYVNGKKAGTTVDSVKRLAPEVSRQTVAAACRAAKENDMTATISKTSEGWKIW